MLFVAVCKIKQCMGLQSMEGHGTRRDAHHCWLQARLEAGAAIWRGQLPQCVTYASGAARDRRLSAPSSPHPAHDENAEAKCRSSKFKVEDQQITTQQSCSKITAWKSSILTVNVNYFYHVDLYHYIIIKDMPK